MNEKVDIEIFKRRLSVEMEGLTPLEINNIAGQVSEKMADMAAQNPKIGDSSKLAILTALAFAGELYKHQGAADTSRKGVHHSIEHAIKLLKESLAAAGQPPER